MAIPRFPNSEGRCLRVTLLFLVCYAAKNALFYGLLGSSADIDLFFLHFFPILVFTCLLFSTVMMRSRIVFLAIYTVNVFYLLFITAYFYHFNDFMRLNSVFTLFGEGFDVISSGSFVFKRYFLIGLFDLPACIYILCRFQKVAFLAKAYYRLRYIVAMLLLIAVFHGALSLSGVNYSTRDEWSNIMAMRHGLAALNAAELLGMNKTALASSGKISYGDKSSTNEGSRPLANVLMIQVESLDANIINYLHDGRPVTPFLNALQKECIYYPYTLSYRGAGGTSDCELAVLNSIEPFGQKPVMRSETYYYYPNAVTKRLSSDVFDIAAFHGNVISFYDRGKAYPLMGFHRFMDINAMHLKKSGWGAADGDVFKFVQNCIAGQKKHFFYYVITMSSHEPFTHSRSYCNDARFDNIPEKLARDYMNSIAYTDQALQSFVEAVMKAAPNTYIFIYGDHTPYIINEGPFRRSEVLLDGRGLEFVPLFIITPDHKKYVEKKRIASYLDFAPTVLSASGASGEMRVNGVNLLQLPLVEDKVVYRYRTYNRKQLFIKASERAM